MNVLGWVSQDGLYWVREKINPEQLKALMRGKGFARYYQAGKKTPSVVRMGEIRGKLRAQVTLAGEKQTYLCVAKKLLWNAQQKKFCVVWGFSF